MKRQVSEETCLFSEIHPGGWVKSSAMMKSPCGDEIRLMPDGWISFHLSDLD
jgi:hypothetical protein